MPLSPRRTERVSLNRRPSAVPPWCVRAQGCGHHRRRGQFEQGNAETIQIPFHLLAVVRRSRLQLPSAVLLQAQDVDADVPILGAQAPMCGEQACVVRWNPEVFDPSTTVFRIVCRWVTGCISNIAATVNPISSASGSCSFGAHRPIRSAQRSGPSGRRRCDSSVLRIGPRRQRPPHRSGRDRRR